MKNNTILWLAGGALAAWYFLRRPAVQPLPALPANGTIPAQPPVSVLGGLFQSIPVTSPRNTSTGAVPFGQIAPAMQPQSNLSVFGQLAAPLLTGVGNALSNLFGGSDTSSPDATALI